ELAKHEPDAGTGARVTGAGTRTTSRKAKEEGEVHGAPPPRRRRLTRDGVLRAQTRWATVALLNAIYEEDFLGFSYGFRPKRGQHNALDALAVGIGTKRVNFILDADVASFFDSVSKEKLVRFVEHRVGDPRIIRLIQKWLKAG